MSETTPPHWQRWLSWRLATAMIAKLLLLTLLWYAFFADDQRPPADVGHLGSRLIPATLPEDSVHD